MYWISYGAIECGVTRPESLKLRVLTGRHSPNEFRVTGVVTNMPEFAEDFNCPLGSPMNPKRKCTVW
jgi:predicted metalloendopeptidase